MERLVLVLVVVVCALAPSLATGWSWLSALTPVVVGAFAFFFNWKADRRADREQARALRAERRAEDAERRAAEAELREREAHGWDRERVEREQEEVRARIRVEEWAARTKKLHGGGWFRLDLKDLDLARAAEALGLVSLKPHRGNDGAIDLVIARID
jgi:hypothetical protein